MKSPAHHILTAMACSAAALAVPLHAQDVANGDPENDDIVVEGTIDVDRGDARDQTRDITPRPTSAMEPLALQQADLSGRLGARPGKRPNRDRQDL